MRYLSFLFLTVCLLLGGCIKSEITLQFELPASSNNPVRVLYYASAKNRGLIRETAVEITQGKGELKLPTVYPSIIYLFSPSQNEPVVAFYAKRGEKIFVKGDSQNMREWSVTGNKLTDEWSEWRIANKTVLAENNPEKVNKAVEAYVKGHPDSKLSLVLLTLYYSRRQDEAGFLWLYSSLKEDVFDDKDLLEALSAADLIEGPQPQPAMPARLVLLGESGYADTLVLKDSVATFIIFTGKEGIEGIARDSLASLISRSRKGKVAEIFMEGDSAAWRRHLMSDSVPGLHRMSMPLGMADTLALQMGLRRVPYYITVSPGGKVGYRGSDFRKAADVYRKSK